MSFDRTKFKALVLYVVWKTGDVLDFGMTKLNKVLWFSDVRAYEAYGRPITGEAYVRKQYGPVPVHAEEVLAELVAEGAILSSLGSYHGLQVRRYVTNARPDTSVFGNDELGLIDCWIKHIGEEHSAVSISEMSHDYGWKIVPTGHPLPYKSFLAKRIRSPREGPELDWAMAAARELATQ